LIGAGRHHRVSTLRMCLPPAFVPNAAAGVCNDLERPCHVGGQGEHPSALIIVGSVSRAYGVENRDGADR